MSFLSCSSPSVAYRYAQSLSHIRLFAAPWTVACQISLSMGFPKQEYWSGLPFPVPGDLPDPGIKPMSLASPALAGRFFTTSATWEAFVCRRWEIKCLVKYRKGHTDS